MSAPRTLTYRQLKALGKRLHTDATHAGKGRAFFVVRRGGDWIKSILPERVLS